MEIHLERMGSQVVCGLRLAGLRRIEIADAAHLEIVERLLSSIDGHPAIRLILQTAVDPDPVAPQRGRVTVHLFAAAPESAAAELGELVEDLLDLLSTPPRPWTFEPVTGPEALLAALAPFDIEHFAQVARRVAPCPPLDRFPAVGYRADEPGVPDEDEVWSVWRFDPRDRRDATLVLLSQEAPIVIRTILSVTELDASERAQLEDLVALTGIEAPIGGIRAASGRVFERMLVGRPLYDARVLVASPAPVGASVLSAIGWSISPPQDDGTDGPLRGGFEAIRGPAGASALWESLGFMSSGTPVDDAAEGRRGRIRRILTMTETATAFGLPQPSPVGSPGLHSTRVAVAEPPIADLPVDGVEIGSIAVGSDRHDVRLALADRTRHLYLTGQTGTGKSTLMGSLILDDIERGAGVAVVDPHGSLVQNILERIPDDRIDDVIVIEPADTDAVVGVNLLEAESEIQKTFIVAELAGMFYTLFDPGHTGIVGPRYETWLRQAAHLLLANPQRPSSMLDIPTVFTDTAVMRLLVKGIDDVVLAEFWKGEMAQTSDYHKSEMLGWFRSKFEMFRMSTSVRRIVGQAQSTISFDDALAEGRIILVNLAKGYLGSYNANLIGFVVMTRLWQATLGRARLPKERRPDFFVYVDEFQSLTTNSLDEMLSEARKFGVGVTLANQFLDQVPDDLQAAIVGNVSTRVAFRLGPQDAQMFASWMGPAVDPEDLTRLANFTAMAAMSNRGQPLDPFVLDTLPWRGNPDPERAERIRARSREQWAMPVDEIDRSFRERWADVEGSFAHGIANSVEEGSSGREPSASSSFLDEWLVKRKREAAKSRAAEADGKADGGDTAGTNSGDASASEPSEEESAG